MRHARHAKVSNALDEGTLSLFYTSTHPAATELSQFKILSGAKSGLQDLNPCHSREATGNFWQIISAPTTDLNLIAKRQSELATLIASESKSSAHAAVLSGYKMYEQFDKLYEPTEYGRRNQGTALEALVQSGYTLEQYHSANVVEEQASESIEPEGLDDNDDFFFNSGSSRADSGDEMASVKQSLASLKNCREALMKCSQSLAEMPSEFWKKIGAELKDELNKLPEDPGEAILKAAIAEDAQTQSDIRDNFESLKSYIEKLEPLFSLAYIIERDSLKIAEFDSTKPELLDHVWHFGRKKSDESFPQGTTESFDDTRITLLSGSNMSGKSFSMARDLVARMTAQSIGYFPGADCNLHMKDCFVWLENGITDPKRKLSSLGVDCTGFNEADKSIRKSKSAIVYLDEPFSSTASLDQAALVCAWMKRIDGFGAKAMCATHNAHILKFWEASESARIYHFTIELMEGIEEPSVRFHRGLKRGMDSSHAFEVAEAFNAKLEIIADAKAFASGEFLNPTPIKRTREIVSYSEEERTALKKQSSRGLQNIIPTLDFLSLTNEGLKVSRTHRKSFPTFSVPTRDNKYWGPVTTHSLDTGPFEDDRNRDTRVAHFVANLISHGVPSDPKEVIERQRTFECLIEGDNAKKLYDLTHDFQDYLARLEFVSGLTKGGPEIVAGMKSSLIKAIRSSASLPQIESKHLEGAFTIFREGIKLLSAISGQSIDETKIEPLLECINELQSVSKLQYALGSDVLAIDTFLKEGEDRQNISFDVLWKRRQEHIGSLQNKALQKVAITPPSVDPEAERYSRKSPHIESVVLALEEALVPFDATVILDTENQTLLEALDKFIKDIREATESFTNQDSDGLYPYYYARTYFCALDPVDRIKEFVETLKQYDSVHLHQLANHYESLLPKFLGDMKSGKELFQFVQTLEGSRRHDFGKNPPLVFFGNATNDARITLSDLESFFYTAKIIKEQNFCKGSFSSEPNIEAKDVWGIHSQKSERVPNSTTITWPTRIELITGWNMSGKTTGIVDLTHALAFCQATGYSPSVSMEMPVFERIGYIDKVQPNAEKNLSGFGNETVIHRNRIKDAEGKLSFFGFDEPNSTTSPGYQAALTKAYLSEAAANGNICVVSLHTPSVVAAFEANAPELVQVYHFETIEDPDSKDLLFTFKKEKGSCPSNGLKVARYLETPDEVLSFAETFDFSTDPGADTVEAEPLNITRPLSEFGETLVERAVQWKAENDSIFNVEEFDTHFNAAVDNVSQAHKKGSTKISSLYRELLGSEKKMALVREAVLNALKDPLFSFTQDIQPKLIPVHFLCEFEVKAKEALDSCKQILEQVASTMPQSQYVGLAKQFRELHSSIEWEMRDLDEKHQRIYAFAAKKGGIYAGSAQGVAELLEDYRFGGQYEVMRNERRGMPTVHRLQELELEVRHQAKLIEPKILQSSAFNLVVRRLTQELRAEHSGWFRGMFGIGEGDEE